jgi:hypothetical protein
LRPLPGGFPASPVSSFTPLSRRCDCSPRTCPLASGNEGHREHLAHGAREQRGYSREKRSCRPTDLRASTARLVGQDLGARGRAGRLAALASVQEAARAVTAAPLTRPGAGHWVWSCQEATAGRSLAGGADHDVQAGRAPSSARERPGQESHALRPEQASWPERPRSGLRLLTASEQALRPRATRSSPP